MDLPHKTLYTIPEAADIISKQYDTSFTVDDLVSYARDGKILFSIFVSEDYLTDLIKKHWAKGSKNLRNSKQFSDTKSAVSTILSKAEKHPSKELIAYLPPDDGIYEHYQFLKAYGTEIVIPIGNVIIDPTADFISIPYAINGVKINGKQVGYIGVFVLDRGNMFGDEDLHWFDNRFDSPVKIEEVRVVKIFITRKQLETLLVQNGGSDEVKNEAESNFEKWGNVTIKLLANNRIAFESGTTRREITMFVLELMNKNTNKLNYQGTVLLGLAKREKYPTGTKPTEAQKQVMKKLRKILRDCTGLDQDPFLPIDPTHGWKPRFKLIDSRDLADQRAKEKARKFKKYRHYKTGDDDDDDDDYGEGAKWLLEHDK